MAASKRRPALGRLVQQARRRDAGPVTDYAIRVIRGEVVTGQLQWLACRRHCADLVHGPGRGLQWAPERADHILAFFEQFLTLTDGRPFVPEPWQRFLVGSIFGWLDADGARRFRVCYSTVAKGNGKSPTAAGIGLYMLLEGEPQAEVYAAAPTKEQARIVWLDAKNMVDASEELSAVVDQRVNNLSVGSSYFRAISSEHRGLAGRRVHCAILDEVQEHYDDQVVLKMQAGQKGRRQPLQIEISNAGFNRESICYRHHEYSQRILTGGVINDAWFAFICAVDPEDDPIEDEACWIKANPNLDVAGAVPRRYLRDQVAAAREMPASLNTVLRLNFSVWTSQRDRALDMTAWDAAPRQPVAAESLEGRPCCAGLDLGARDDFSALILIWILDDGAIATRAWFWVPQGASDRYPDRPYAAWRSAGASLTTIGREIVAYQAIQDDVVRICQEYRPVELAYDARFAAQLAQNVESALADTRTVDQPQGWRLSEACTVLSEMVTAEKIHHGHDPILSWHAGNLIFRQGQRGDLRPDKNAPGEKMDGAVALLMALQAWLRFTAEPDVVYEDRGLLTI